MRLVTYREPNHAATVGVVDADAVYQVVPEGSSEPVHTMLDLIEATQGAHVRLARHGAALPLAQVHLMAPISGMRSDIICVGRNYADHAAESARARNQEVGRPTFFSKAAGSVIGPYDDIPFDEGVSSQIDWEAELAVIIGRTARLVQRESAQEYIFGYTVLNDLSARDLQYGFGGQFFYGKSFDGACPMGPEVVTREELDPERGVKVQLRVNGVQKQQGNTADMIFSIGEIIETLSRVMTLRPGQVIATGTPAGVGFAREPKEFLKPGDRVETSVAGIGTLRNTVVAVPT